MSITTSKDTQLSAEQPREQAWRHHLRRLGFMETVGVDEMQADFFGTRVSANPLRQGGFELTMRRHGPRTVLVPGGPRLPNELDALQIREEIWNGVRRTLPRDQLPALGAALRPDLATATRRAISAMTAGTYRRFIDTEALSAHGSQYRYGTGTSAERTAAEVTAEHSSDPDVVTRLATEHPDPEIRALAVANPACPPTVLLYRAESEPAGVARRALLAQSNRATGLAKVLTVNVLTRGPRDEDLACRLVLHPETAEEHLAALWGHALRADPSARLRVAHAASSAPPQRRDSVHGRLLLDARRIPYTLTLIRTILGEQHLDNHDRVRWMTHHPHAKIRSHFNYYLHHEAEPETQRGAEPPAQRSQGRRRAGQVGP